METLFCLQMKKNNLTLHCRRLVTTQKGGGKEKMEEGKYF